MIDVDHDAAALARVPEQFRDKVAYLAMVGLLTSQANALETAYQALYGERDVDNAIGAQLDDIGAKVGQPRDGITDDDVYRRYVRARIATNRSKGRIRDLIAVALLVLGDDDARIVVDNQGAAAVVLRVEDVAVAAALAAVLYLFLDDTASAGVRLILETNTTIDTGTSGATPFRWDTADAGWDDGVLWDAEGG